MIHRSRSRIAGAAGQTAALMLCLLVAGPAASPAQGTGSAPGPPPTVDVYGTDHVTGRELLERYDSEFRALAEYARGDTTALTPGIRARLREGIRAIGDFAWIDLSVVAYPGEETLRIGITLDVVERADSARRMAFRAPPSDTVPDPGGLLEAWREYEVRAFRLLRSGELSADTGPCGAHHCFLGFDHDQLAAYGREFSAEVPRRADALRRVLREDADPRKRNSAAYLLAHLEDPQRVADHLVPAIPDPDDGVRNAVLRVLWQLAANPEVTIPLDPLLTALDYPSATDRNKAASALLHLAERPEYRERILREAGPILLEMLSLKQPNNHDPALGVLRELSGRDLGEDDVEAWRRWWQEATGRSNSG